MNTFQQAFAKQPVWKTFNLQYQFQLLNHLFFFFILFYKIIIDSINIFFKKK